MNDLISRQAAIDAVSRGCHEFRGIFAECEKNLNALPSAERHGRWKPFDLTYGRSIYFCTACNEAVGMPTFNGKPMYKYCPNCGSRMDLDGDTE